MITLGIDPGTAIMGYGLVESGVAGSGTGMGAGTGTGTGTTWRAVSGGEELRLIEYGALHTPANTPMAERLPMLYEGLMQLLGEYKPNSMAIEQLFFNKNV